MAVRIQAEPNFTYGNPEVVFETTYFHGTFRGGRLGFGRTYDIASDGRRFLMIKPISRGGESEPTQLILVQNWLDELKRLVPVDN